MAEVLQFPARKSCFECSHVALTGTGSTFCMLFREEIWFETTTAEECEAYEPN